MSILIKRKSMKRYFVLILFMMLLVHCNKIYQMYNSNVSGVELNDEVIEKYIKAVRALHKLGPNLPQELAEKGESAATGLEVFNQIESVIKEAGFKDYYEFVKVNSKVAWAWNVSQGEIGMQKFQVMKDSGIQRLDESLNDPNVPDDVKAELRKTRQEILDNWAQNKPYADLAMKVVRPLTNEHDLEVIKRNQKNLMEAFTGRPLEELQEIDPNLFLKK